MTYILRIQWVSFLNRLVPFYFCIPFYVTGPSIKTLVSMACLYIVSIKLAPAGGGSSLGVSVSPQSAPTSLSWRETGEAPSSHRNLLMLLLLPSPHNGSFLVWEITVLWIWWELWESRPLGLNLPRWVADSCMWWTSRGFALLSGHWAWAKQRCLVVREGELSCLLPFLFGCAPPCELWRSLGGNFGVGGLLKILTNCWVVAVMHTF